MILLDTHVLIWLASDPSKLSKKAAEAIRSSIKQGGIAISAITLWELAWLATHGRLSFGGTVEDFVEKISSRTAIRPITVPLVYCAKSTELLENKWVEFCMSAKNVQKSGQEYEKKGIDRGIFGTFERWRGNVRRREGTVIVTPPVPWRGRAHPPRPRGVNVNP